MSQIIETRDGSGNLYQQFIHGTRYIDELVMVRVKDKGDLYVHQDANWNVIGLTDLGGSLVERHVYRPYGEITVNQETGYGDRDGDGDVDATDKGTPGTDCTGTVSGACRILDLDFDGDYDSADATLFDSLPQGLASHPGRIATGVDQTFGHQGLLFEPAIGSYQNRARRYLPTARRFAQRDPEEFVDGANAYLYVRGNPIVNTDSSGKATCPDLTPKGGSAPKNKCRTCRSSVYTWSSCSGFSFPRGAALKTDAVCCCVSKVLKPKSKRKCVKSRLGCTDGDCAGCIRCAEDCGDVGWFGVCSKPNTVGCTVSLTSKNIWLCRLLETNVPDDNEKIGVIVHEFTHSCGKIGESGMSSLGDFRDCLDDWTEDTECDEK